MNKVLLMFQKIFLTLCIMGITSVYAQTPTISYPTVAQALTRGLDTSLLTVKIAFSGACSATTTTIALAPSVTYVPGSVNKTAGNGATIAIAESDISNLNAPVFSLSGITVAGDITFTIQRQAGCGSLSSGKDTIIVNSSCGNTAENAAGINTYYLFAPVVNIIPPVTITGALLNTNYSRTFTVTNGGNGCTDTLRFYIVYPGGGIKLQDAPTNTIIVNGINFTPWSADGDTLFYKIFGATIFGGDNLMCNGDSVHITENIKLLTCNASTNYGAYWGKTVFPGCQTATGTSSITMATGSAIPGASFTVVQQRSECRPGIYRFIYTNTGSGGNAGAMYNVTSVIGFGSPNLFAIGNGRLGGIFYDSVKFGTNAANPNLTLTGSYPQYIVDAAQFLADPDGAGAGLDDLDGDGQYDDLAPGKSFTLTVYDHYLCSSTCPFTSENESDNTVLTYNTMCGGGTSTTGSLLSGVGIVQKSANASLPVTGPAQIQGGIPFTLNACTAGFTPPPYRPYDTAYMLYILPAGVTLSGNATLNGVALPPSGVYIRAGSLGAPDTLCLTAKGPNERSCWSVDLLYTCASGSTLTISVINQYIGDNSCPCGLQNLQCGSISLSAKCSGNTCSSGLLNNQSPVVTRTTLGWTDATLSTKVSSVSGIPSNTVLPYDTFNIHSTAIQNLSFNNAHYMLQIGKASGKSVFTILPGAVFNFRDTSGTVTTCTLGAPADSSTASLQKYFWDLSSCLPGGTIITGDSIWIDITAAVNPVNNYLLYGQGLKSVPNSSSYFFNLDSTGVQNFCNFWPLNLYADGIAVTENAATVIVALACNNASLSASVLMTDGNNYDVFPGELRPDFLIDSIIVTLPAGYAYNPAVSPTWKNGFWSSTFVQSSSSTNIVPVVSGNQVSFYKSSSTLLPSDIMYNGSSIAGQLTMGILPTCTAPVTSSSASVKLYAKAFAYAPALERDTIITNTNVSYTYPLLNRPSISIQNNTGVVQGVASEQSWDVQINNPSTQTAPNIWIAFEKNTSSIIVDSVQQLPSGPLYTMLNYGGTNEWYQINTPGLASGASQQARVYFHYSSCNADSILMKAGWNCTGYPSPDPTAFSCSVVQQYLQVIPQPSQVQLSILRQPGNGSNISLCSLDSVIISMNSAQTGNLISPYAEVYPPPGVTIQTPVMVETPLGSGNYQPVTTTPTGTGGYKIDLTAHTAIGANGLPGTTQNPGSAGRQAKIVVVYTTDCSITSGSSFSFYGYGKEPCGINTIGNGVLVQTAGVNIAGATTPGTIGVSLSSTSSTLTCGTFTTLTLSATPLTSPTQIGDTVVYMLPAGLDYDGNFTTGANCVACTIGSSPGPNNTTLIKIALQPGVISGAQMDYGFDIMAAGKGCNSNITATAKRDIGFLLCGAGLCSSNGAAIVGTGSLAMTINKPLMDIHDISFTQADSTINYSVEVANNGTADAAAGYLVKMYCGSSAGIVLSSFTTTGSINVGNTGIYTGSFVVPSADCSDGTVLFAQVEDTLQNSAPACLCNSSIGTASSIAIPIKLYNFNASSSSGNTLLNWNTANEQNSNYFEIEYSTDAKTWQKVTIVPAAGNSNNNVHYNYMHLNASSLADVLYYRLKLVDKNGLFSYSDTRVVEFAKNDDVEIVPNPTTGNVTIRFSEPSGSAGYYKLINTVGQVLINEPISSSTQYLPLDLNKYPKGVYEVIIQTEQVRKVIKLVKD
jgi:hypothetical protein